MHLREVASTRATRTNDKRGNTGMTNATAKERVRMTVPEARSLGEAAMRGAGYDDHEARILTDHVLDAALCG